MLHGLGRLAAKYQAHVHSHISESIDQVEFSASLHPHAANDAAVYHEAGLLTSRSLFAHATRITDDALQMMATAGAAISHCPLSNFYFGDGLLDVTKAMHLGVKVGLGTDIAGGYSPSMLQAMRMAVINSRALRAAALMHAASDADLTKLKQAAVITWEEALYLATMGGAHALGLDSTIGSFAVGNQFDALLIDTKATGCFDVFPHEGPAQLLEKFLNNGDDRNIAQVFVQGRRCK
eukprot:jgi/Chrzof1/10036/Cz04g24270.t1